MEQIKHDLAEQIQWIDPSGQRNRLSPSEGGELHITIDSGAVEIRATDCILKMFGLPGGLPDIERIEARLHITIALSTCQVNWKLQ